jgi:hypothetical protein
MKLLQELGSLIVEMTLEVDMEFEFKTSTRAYSFFKKGEVAVYDDHLYQITDLTDTVVQFCDASNPNLDFQMDRAKFEKFAKPAGFAKQKVRDDHMKFMRGLTSKKL